MPFFDIVLLLLLERYISHFHFLISLKIYKNPECNINKNLGLRVFL